MNTHRGDHWITEMFEYLSVFIFGCLGHLANWSWLWNIHILLYINRGSSKPPVRLERHPSCSICYKGSNKQIHCNSPIFMVSNQFTCICCLRFGGGSLWLTIMWILKKKRKKDRGDSSESDGGLLMYMRTADRCDALFRFQQGWNSSPTCWHTWGILTLLLWIRLKIHTFSERKKFVFKKLTYNNKVIWGNHMFFTAMSIFYIIMDSISKCTLNGGWQSWLLLKKVVPQQQAFR